MARGGHAQARPLVLQRLWNLILCSYEAQVPPSSRYDGAKLGRLHGNVKQAEVRMKEWKQDAVNNAALDARLQHLRSSMDAAAEELKKEIGENARRIDDAEMELKELQVLQLQV